MTREERKAEFDRIFEALPGTNIERIRIVAKLLHIPNENYVRIMRLNTENCRVIPEAKLLFLKRELKRNRSYAAAAA